MKQKYLHSLHFSCLVCVGYEMRCKNVNSFVMPLNPSYSQTFPHEYFSIKPPETTAVSEGNQASLDDRELGEHCQT